MENMNDDLISRQAAIDIEQNETVDTNPYHFEAHQKFIQFMDDSEISSFGRWQWSNGFNTALIAVGIDLKMLPSAQPERQVELDGTESNIEILSELRAQFNCFDEVEEPVYRALSDAICALSAQPERKKGEWVEVAVTDGYDIEGVKTWVSVMQCDQCGFIVNAVEGHMAQYNYCPNCGSYNGGNEE